MLARLELGQQLFDGPLYLRELLDEGRPIHDRVITRYRPRREEELLAANF